MPTIYDKGVDEDFIDDRPSKTKRKQAMHALQDIGEELVALSRDRLRQVPLTDDLRAAVEQAQRITSHEGKRRQLQYIGKLMRNLDCTPIRTVLEGWRGDSKAATAHLHLVERWRERLLADDEVLTAFAIEYPQVHEQDNLQILRTCIRNARKEQAAGKPPKAFRELFQLLKQWL